MEYLLIITGLLGAWAMLATIGTERAHRLQLLQHEAHLAAERARRAEKERDKPTVVG